MQTEFWFVFYTKARWEKRVFDILTKFGFEAFLPLVKELHQWTDRKKLVEVPLFRSYIFVKAQESQIQDILKIPGIAWSIRQEGTPSYLRNKDKELIERALDSGYQINEESVDEFLVGDRVKVQQGPLSGLSGAVIKGQKDQLLIRIDSLDKVIRVLLPAGIISKN